MKLLFKGGTVISGEKCEIADVLVQGEKILETGPDITCNDAQVIDVRGRLIFPGFIDAHTHFDLEVAGTVTADDFSTGTRAALRGGTTTVIDFATQYHGETLHTALSNWNSKARGNASCDYGFHMAISDWNDAVSEELEDMIRLGIPSFKLYMTYDAMMVGDKTIFQILRRLKELGGIAGVHCENSGIIAAMVEEQKQLGHRGVASHPRTRPDIAEAEAIDRLLRIARIVDTPVIIVHLSSQEGYEAVERARTGGQTVFVETCPQYLLLDDSLYDLAGTDGLNYVAAPPLRRKKDQESLWHALAEGRIQTICTDHCSFTTAQKKLGQEDFEKIPGGMPGVETRGVLIYTYGVEAGRISLPRMCRLLSENPAKLYGLYPAKGCIAPGSDADIVVFDPAAAGVIHAEDLIQHTDYTPFEGFRTRGLTEQVYLRGRLVVAQGSIVAGNTGCFVARSASSL
ncbi:MAG: dihydropyrimidinase [Saccharofermentanales bacterium]